VLKNASLVYKRRPPQPGEPANEPEQETVHLTCAEMTYTNEVEQLLNHRLPACWQQKHFEVNGYPAFTGYLSIDTVRTHCNNAVAIDYEVPFNGTLQKRLIEYTREQYRDDDGTTPLAFGTLAAKGLKHQSYKAAFNAAMLSNIFSVKITPAALDALLTDVTKGAYLFANGYYWISSGVPQYDPLHFFLTTAVTDPFGHTSTVEYDAAYSLFVKRSIDALANNTKIKEIAPGRLAFNYRTLSPYITQDINYN
jgi:YD repeat-containing protein